MKVFSYYWKGERQTSVDDAFLRQLTAGEEDQEGIIEGIKASARAYSGEAREGNKQVFNANSTN